jgi:hypothetical protein
MACSRANFTFFTAVCVCVTVGIKKCLSVRAYTRWFKYDRDDLCVNKSQFVPVIFEPPCICVIT